MRTLLILVVFFAFGKLYSQEITVIDQESGMPIYNVALFNKDKSKTAVTNFEGKCDLTAFSNKERIILKHLSFITYKTTKNQLIKGGKKAMMAPNAQQLDEVIMSVSKWEQQKKDIPQKITTLNTAAISFTNPQTSADLLQSSGKVFVQKSQLGGGSPMIRGFATNRLLIVVDGVRMNNAIFRGGNLQNIIAIDPFTIKKTEVVFGPGSVIYGSDAMGGVMNFYTKTAKLTQKDSVNIHGELNYRYSSVNTENTLHAEVGLGTQKWSSFSSITYNSFQDLKMGINGPDSYLRKEYVIRQNNTDLLIANSDPRSQTPTSYNQINALQKITFKPSNRWSFNFGAYYSETSDYDRYDRLIRPATDGNGLRNAEWYYGPQKWFMGTIQGYNKAKGSFYDALKLNLAYQNFQESRNYRRFQNPVRNTTEENVDAISINADFENKRLGNFKFFYGLELLHNKVGSKGSSLNIEDGTKETITSRYPDGSKWQSVAAYLNSEYKIKPNFTVLSGLRYSHVWIDAEFSNEFYPFPFTEANLSTGALTSSVGFSWFPKANLQITLNGSTGFRSPNIDDVGKIFDSEPGSVVVPNPDLEPEYAYNIDFGVQKNFGDKLVFKAATFYTHLVDALVRRDFDYNGQSEIIYDGELSNVQAIQNAAKAFVYGFEFGVDAFINENISVNANLTLTKGEEENNNGAMVAARSVAPTFGDLHFVWRNQAIKADLFLNYNGEIPFKDLAPSERTKTYIYAKDANGDPYAPSWATINFRSQWRISNNVKATATWENISNERYRSYSSGIVAPGSNLIVGIGYTF